MGAVAFGLLIVIALIASLANGVPSGPRIALPELILCLAILFILGAPIVVLVFAPWIENKTTGGRK